MKKIVAVQYKAKEGDGFGGREYSYYSDMRLKKGDIVLAPTKYGDALAKVSRINVPVAEAVNIMHLMRTIPQQEVLAAQPMAHAAEQQSLFEEETI